MKVLKIIGIIVLALVVIIGGFLVLGPSEGYLERSTSIDAPMSEIQADLNNMKVFNRWSPWYQLDENARYEWSESSIGVGAKLTWYSNDENVGNGSMEIIEVADDKIRYKMLFDMENDGDLENNADEPAFAGMLMSEEGGATNVKWTFESGKMTGFGKIFLLFLENFLGPQYEQGLKNLKERIENRPEFSVDIAAVEVAPFTFIGMQSSSSLEPQDISKAMGDAYGKIMGYMSQNNIQATGYPFAVYTNYDESSMDFICGLPVAEGTDIDSDELVADQSYKGLVVKAIHKGAYAKLGDTHSQVDQYITYQGYELAGPPWEDYPVDPILEPDTSKWITNVYYPVN